MKSLSDVFIYVLVVYFSYLYLFTSVKISSKISRLKITSAFFFKQKMPTDTCSVQARTYAVPTAAARHLGYYYDQYHSPVPCLKPAASRWSALRGCGLRSRVPYEILPGHSFCYVPCNLFRLILTVLWLFNRLHSNFYICVDVSHIRYVKVKSERSFRKSGILTTISVKVANLSFFERLAARAIGTLPQASLDAALKDLLELRLYSLFYTGTTYFFYDLWLGLEHQVNVIKI